ncbi:MAG: hypothetical protein LIO54_05420 [Oscillospiraceae bacterium]|nr:hypothetical protein [Oscillospiraceae bacterium]
MEEQIAALPALDEVQAMTGDEEEAVYARASALADVYYDDLTADEQAQVSNIDTLWDILDYFSSGLTLTVLSVNTTWYNDTDTSFTLYDAADLAGLASLVNAGNNFDGKTIVLGNSIDLNSEEWTPIGTSSSYPFSGTFDGNDYTVSGLYINDTSSSASRQGLFGYNGGTVKNVTVSGNVTGNYSVGGVVGTNTGTVGSVTNCYYLNTTASAAYRTNNGTLTNVESKTSTQFASGEVTYLLTGGVTDGTQAWYQTLGTDSYPVLDSTHGTVYYTTAGCDNSTVTGTYSNSSVIHVGGSYDSGFCTNCVNGYEPATLNGSTYEISNAGQLFWFASLVNGDTTQEGITVAVADANAVLTANIDLDGKEWTPIGNQADSQSLSYTGTFDGGGHTISGLYINNSSSSYQGLFGYLRNGKVQNVTVSGNVTGNAYVGGVVGADEGGTVTNCGSSASISGNRMVGGVIGSISNGSTVKYCINSGDVTDCYNIGEVSGSNIVGGVVGNNYSGASVSNCYYLTGTATAAIGSDNGTSTSVAAKTAAEFASGEVAYLLNGSVSAGTTWYQNIDRGTADSYPVLDSSHGAVYYGTNCAGTAIYSNSTVPAATHSLTHVEPHETTCTETGNSEYWYCSVCGGYFSNMSGGVQQP